MNKATLIPEQQAAQSSFNGTSSVDVNASADVRGPLIYLNMKNIFPLATWAGLGGGFFLTAAGSLMAIAARDLAVNVADLAFLGSAYGLMMLINGIIAPYLLRFGPVWALRIAPIFAAMGVVMMVWGSSVAAVLIGSAICALGVSVTSIANPALFFGTGGARYLSLVCGVSSGMSVATTIIFALTEKLWPGSGRYALLFMVIVVLVQFIVAWRTPVVPFSTFIGLRKDIALRAQINQISEARFNVDSEASRHDEDLQRRASTSVVLAQIVRILLCTGAEFALYAWGVERLMNVGVSLAAASALATGFAIGMALGRVALAGLLGHRYAWKALVAVALCGTLISGFVPNMWAVAAGLVIVGIGASGMYPLCAADFSGLPGIEPRKSASLINIVCGVGALMTPLLLGALLAVASLQVGFGVLALMFVALFFIPRPR